MTWSVYQHWDPLKVCVVGRSYPPEFYSWITVPHVRELFERIAIETEEDFQKIINKLKEFGVEVLRPDLPDPPSVDGQFIMPPIAPRDTMVMIGDTFYNNYHDYSFNKFYYTHKEPHWLHCQNETEINTVLSGDARAKCQQMWDEYRLNSSKPYNSYNKIFDRIISEGSQFKNFVNQQIAGAMVSRIGKDLYFGTMEYQQDVTEFSKIISKEFPNTRNHIVNTGGHSDGTFCPVAPGLIISLYDVPTYADSFPGWEVVYLPKQSWAKVSGWRNLRVQNDGKWWIPGFEHDQDVINVVESWLKHWTGYVEETVFDVNMLIIDPKNVIVFNYNKQVFDALARFGITPHIVTFRHRYFWDGGVHCVTLDLHREGAMQDYFPGRSNV